MEGNAWALRLAQVSKHTLLHPISVEELQSILGAGVAGMDAYGSK